MDHVKEKEEGGGGGEPVLKKLAIKNPAQGFEDFEYKVPVGWTVGQLKEFLSQEYKGKPAVSEQKLIYSGKILDNKQPLSETVLKRAVQQQQQQSASENAATSSQKGGEEGGEREKDDEDDEEEVVAKVHLVVQSFMCSSSPSTSASTDIRSRSTRDSGEREADGEGSANGTSFSSSSSSSVMQERATSRAVGDGQGQSQGQGHFSSPSPPPPSSSSLLRNGNMRQEQPTSPFIASPLPQHHVPVTPEHAARTPTSTPGLNGVNATHNTSCSSSGFRPSTPMQAPHQTPQTPQTPQVPMSPAFAAAYDAALRAIVGTTPQTPLPSPSPSMFYGAGGSFVGGSVGSGGSVPAGAAAAAMNANMNGFQQQGMSPFHMMASMPSQYPYAYAPNPYSPYAMMSPLAFYQPTFPGYQGMDPSLMVASQANPNPNPNPNVPQPNFYYGGMAQSAQAQSAGAVAGQDRRPNGREGESASQQQQQFGQGQGAAEINNNNNNNNNNAANNQNQQGRGQNQHFWNYVNVQLTLKLFVLGIIINHDGSMGRLMMTGMVFLFVYMQQIGLFSANGVFIQKFCAWYSSVFRRLDNVDHASGGTNARPVNGFVRLFIEVQWFLISLVASLLPSFSPESFTQHLSRQQAQHARPHQD